MRPELEPALRQSAALALGHAHWSDQQLLRLAKEVISRGDPLVSSRVLNAFKGSENPEVGRVLIEALSSSPQGLDTFAEEALNELLAGYPPSVQQSAQPLTQKFHALRQQRTGRLQQFETELKGGSTRRGREVFFGKKAACFSCHTIGSAGGRLGPDLTSIGAIRSKHDLLEAIIFPSASFLPGFQPYRVRTRSEIYAGVIHQRTAEAIVLSPGPDSSIRIPREEIVSMEPSSVSIMPEGLDQSLSSQELADLIAFLEGQTIRPQEKGEE